MWARHSRSATHAGARAAWLSRSRSSADLMNPRVYSFFDHSSRQEVARQRRSHFEQQREKENQEDKQKELKLPDPEQDIEELTQKMEMDVKPSVWDYVLKILSIVIEYALTLAVVCFWTYVLFSMMNVLSATEKSYDKRHCVIPSNTRLDTAYQYYVTPLQAEEITLNLIIEGAFIPELQQQREYNEQMMVSDQHKRYVFVCTLERWIFHKKYDPKEDTRKLVRPTVPADVQTHSAALAKIMMVNDTGTVHMYPLDYSNYPRKARLVLTVHKAEANKTKESNATSDEEPTDKESKDIKDGKDKKKKDVATYYALGFGVDKSQPRAVPFSIEYKVDPISMRTRVLIGMIPMVVLSVLLLLGINRGIASLVAICTAAAGYAKTGEGAKNVDLINWWDSDLLVYIFAVNLMISLLVESKIYHWIAYRIVWLTRLNFWLTALVVNVVAIIMSAGFNNIFIASLLLPLTIRLMELVNAYPWPVILNLAFLCNNGGRTYLGTLITKDVLEHTKSVNAGMKASDMFSYLGWGAILAALQTMMIFYLIYATCAPQYAGKIREVTENVQYMHLWYKASLSLPDVSLRYHILRQKITVFRQHLLQETIWLQQQKKPYHLPSQRKTTSDRLQEMAEQNKIHNGYLLLKCMIIIVTFFALMVPYVYHIEMKNIWNKGESIRLGYIALYVILLSLLFVHCRDFEVLMKRIDWQGLLIFLCLSFIARVFEFLTKHMDDFLWKTYGAVKKAKRVENVREVLKNLIPLTSVAGIFNDHSVCIGLMDTILEFSVFKGFNALKEILGGFLLMTGFWGHATFIGTAVNIVIAGMADQQGHRIRMYRWLMFGLPVAVCNVLLVYVYIYLRYLQDVNLSDPSKNKTDSSLPPGAPESPK